MAVLQLCFWAMDVSRVMKRMLISIRQLMNCPELGTRQWIMWMGNKLEGLVSRAV